MTTKELPGTTAFLNGEPGLHDIDQPVFDSMKEQGSNVVLLDDLFEQPEKLAQIAECDNLVLFTTGIQASKILPLMTAFINMNYIPRNVIFISEGTALAFVSIARDLREKGTSFWFVDFMDHKTLYDISWI